MSDVHPQRTDPPAVHETLHIDASPAEIYGHAMAVGHCAPFLPSWLRVEPGTHEVTVTARLGPIARKWHARLETEDAPGRIAWTATDHQGEAALDHADGGPTRLEVRIWSADPWSDAMLANLRRGLAAFAAHVEQRRESDLVHEGAHSH